jgi:NAD+ kinase
MNIAIYIGKREALSDPAMISLVSELEEGGCAVNILFDGDRLENAPDMLLSVGGDGTFLSASKLVGGRDIPVMGVNTGRLGFLSENRASDVARAILSSDYTIENRAMLKAEISTGSPEIDSWPYALNEFTVHRSGAAMLGVQVSVDGVRLPTYWADGLIISTSSGSTAYSLSSGGPIVLPESKVLIITPIAPHNLNVRPLVVPDTAEIRLRMDSRDADVIFTADNRTSAVSADTEIGISVAQFSLMRVRLKKSNFINALTEKLFWGEDVRNND